MHVLYGRYFIDTDETRFLRVTFSIAAHHLKFLGTLHKKIEVMCVIPQHTDFVEDLTENWISESRRSVKIA
jgi:hypothetical protein